MIVNSPGERPRQVAGSSSSEWFIGSFFGDVSNPQGWLKWRGDTSLDWTWHNWDMNWTVHFVDGYWEQIDAVQFDGFYKRHCVFFQAEDGIRDKLVTGVQTCALPISLNLSAFW